FLLIISLVAVFSQLSLQVANAASSNAASAIKPWDSFNGVTFVAPKTWYAVGASGALLTSTDGGRDWTRRELAQRGPGSWFDLFSVRFARDRLSGWITGERGVILHTGDGGLTWTRQKMGTQQNLLSVAVIDSQRACAAGTDGLIVSTNDAGQTWQS